MGRMGTADLTTFSVEVTQQTFSEKRILRWVRHVRILPFLVFNLIIFYLRLSLYKEIPFNRPQSRVCMYVFIDACRDVSIVR